MSYRIIGISGAARSGKDTAADHIISKRPTHQKVSFADPIKAMLRVGLGLTEAQLYGKLKDVVDERYGCTPRHMLQTLGTQWGRRSIHNDIWVIAMDNHLKSIDFTPVFILPDIRFENEAAFVREHGTMIHIIGRDDQIKESDHESEHGVEVIPLTDYVIKNDASLDLLKHMVMRAILNIEGEC